MIFNKQVLGIHSDEDYFKMSDEEIITRWGPSKFPTAMSAAHKEQEQAKATKRAAAEVKKGEVALKKAALAEKRAKFAAEKEKLAGMDAATKKAYLRQRKLEKTMESEPKLL